MARLIGGRSSAWLEPQIVDLAVAGSNPVDHPILSWGFCHEPGHHTEFRNHIALGNSLFGKLAGYVEFFSNVSTEVAPAEWVPLMWA